MAEKLNSSDRLTRTNHEKSRAVINEDPQAQMGLYRKTSLVTDDQISSSNETKEKKKKKHIPRYEVEVRINNVGVAVTGKQKMFLVGTEIYDWRVVWTSIEEFKRRFQKTGCVEL